MRILRFDVRAVDLRAGRPGHLVRLTDDRGNLGVGEASPLPGYSPDDAALCPKLLSEAASQIDHVPGHVAEIEAWLGPLDSILANAPAARFALETAILDLLAQRRNVPLSVLLGGKEDARVAVNGVVGTEGTVERWVDDAHALVARKIRTIKVKVGRTGDLRREAHELAVMCALLPRDIELRLDANGSLGDDLQAKLTRLSPLRPSFIEEPVHGERLLSLGKRPVRWAADESLMDPMLAARVMDAEGCAAIVLKPAILGGILRCRGLAAKAGARGIGVVVTHTFDGDVAHAAACELALSLDSPLACGLDSHDGMTMPSPHLVVPGFVTASGRIGVGAAA